MSADETVRADLALVVKRSVTIAGHRTSISLEEPFWRHLKAMAAADGQSMAAFIAEIDRHRQGNLSSALRLVVLEALEARIAERPPGT